MPLILNSLGEVICPHAGRVMLSPRQVTVIAGGGYAICLDDVVGAPIVGCVTPDTKLTAPCKRVVAVLPGSTSMVVSVASRPVCVETLTGLTDGRPPGTISVASPGQVSVDA